LERETLPKSMGYLLTRVCKAHHSRARVMLNQIGLYRGQQFVLCALWEKEGLTHSELADKLHVHPATVSNALQRMERAGFLERRADPQDQRVSRVYLTEAGRQIQGAVERVWAELERETLRGFSDGEREMLAQFFVRLCENLGGASGCCRGAGAGGPQRARPA